ncbi:MAG: Imm70 family immunity protein [Chloracidobacterium sp.]|uniref:Immunity 70 family protein n=1 Tax=Chloracidobacterium validum TaxID=2821543 RepID=A0ABX8B7J6_9BACT|nr:Imm70 family immunity protein [Chloracidobacterium validum]QUW02922.1 immunity 70 family protein [Chloracidobacterium validum]
MLRIFLWVDTKRYEIGSPAFFHCFFSTIAYRLEQDAWGSVYPCIMLEFYKGRLDYPNAAQALSELDAIQLGLEVLPPTDIVWDYDDLSRQPPWADGVLETLSCAAECFFTPSEEHLFTVLRQAFTRSAEVRHDVRIRRMA